MLEAINEIADGSSALAEIDPSHTRRARLRCRLLRARGDRPHAREEPEERGEAPPRSRRSTQARDRRGLQHHGSSALAEIDPARSRASRSDRWLLRARGDRPTMVGFVSLGVRAPPRSRRSTRVWSACHAGLDGSSALAEIDPRLRRPCSATAWLLRARGDRPFCITAPTISPMAPPRSRRSTRGCASAGVPASGSSALAEIDPHTTGAVVGAGWLLRARGDRPRLSTLKRPRSEAPPRSRRST